MASLSALSPMSLCRSRVLPPSIHARLAVELGVSQGWHRYVGDRGDMLGVERFGASAPAGVLLREYGFTVDEVCRRALALRVADFRDLKGVRP